MKHVEGAAQSNTPTSYSLLEDRWRILSLFACGKKSDDKPVLDFPFSYRNFFGIFGKADSVYRIVWQESVITRFKIFTLSGLLATNKVIQKTLMVPLAAQKYFLSILKEIQSDDRRRIAYSVMWHHWEKCKGVK